MDAEIPEHPRSGKITGQYITSDDGSVKVAAVVMTNEAVNSIRESLNAYKWKDGDFILMTYPKNGTHLMWEAMSMLLNNSAEYIMEAKELCMMDLFPVTKLDDHFPSPRVLNTHYRLDVLPAEFQKRKTVIVLRNPKDVCVSYYHMETKVTPLIRGEKTKGVMASMSVSDYLKMFLYSKDTPYGNYFDYTEYMWSLRDNPNVHVAFFEDLIKNPVAEIEKVNKFMGTERSPELIQQVADATNFGKMKGGKSKVSENEELIRAINAKPETFKKFSSLMYRKGQVGNWKENFCVADNEMFDSFLEKWTAGKDIPFTYV